MSSTSQSSLTDRTLIIIGIVTGAVMIAFITIVMVKTAPDYSLWNIFWIDGLMVLVAALSTWRGVGILRNRRLSDQDITHV